ncbi:MAG: TolC family protein [Pseudomonadota bacterium]|jgi:outer membrane protein TolC|nr:TolC family protein [Pseudomonadota bacterium]
MNAYRKGYRVACGLVACLLLSPSVSAAELTLEQAVEQALAQDLWLDSSRYNEVAKQAMAEAAGALPDPKISLTLANMPTDGFDFGQEGMSQFSLAISQTLPRGATLELAQRRFGQEAELQPLRRQERRAQVRLQVSQLWLEAWRARESLQLIDANRELFEQLQDVATSSYVTALGGTRQQDVVRARLELTQLDDKIHRLKQQHDTLIGRLSEWLAAASASNPKLIDVRIADVDPALELERRLPVATARESRARFFIQHPSVVLFDQQIDLAQTDITLAKQSYKPAWGLTASYGYRGDDPAGQDRADLVTLGVSMEMPLFSTRRPDAQVTSNVSRAQAIRTDRLLKLRQLLAAHDSSMAALERLNQRLSLYRRQLLPQTALAAEAALNAYTQDAGDFAEVVRARIAELNTRLAEIEIVAEQQEQIAQLNYLLTQVRQEEMEYE